MVSTAFAVDAAEILRKRQGQEAEIRELDASAHG